MKDQLQPETVISNLWKKIKGGKVKCFNCDNKAICIHHKNKNHSDNNLENLTPICQKCHNEIHEITPKMSEMESLIRSYWDIQGLRQSMDNRIRSYSRIDYPTENFEEVAKGIKIIEKKLKKQIEEIIKTHPIYEEASKVKGLGFILIAGLVSIIEDPRRFSNPSKLWKFFGLHTENGRAVKRRKGKKLGFSMWRRDFAWKIGAVFNKNRNRSKMGKLLVQYHNFYRARDSPKLSKMHILNRAKRKTVKIFLACFWAKWMELLGENPVTPYATKFRDHRLITWGDIALAS